MLSLTPAALAPPHSPAGLLMAASGCALRTLHRPRPWPDVLQTLLPTDVLLLGENTMRRSTSSWNSRLWPAGRTRLLAALVIEMAEQGHDTRALEPSANETQVQAALDWNTPMPGPGLRVWSRGHGRGARRCARAGRQPCPCSALRATMEQTSLDALLTPAQRARQNRPCATATAACCPRARIPGMVRVQVAAMCTWPAPWRRPCEASRWWCWWRAHGMSSAAWACPALPENIRAKVVIAHAGQSPTAIKIEANLVQQTPELPPDDACASLRQRWSAAPAR